MTGTQIIAAIRSRSIDVCIVGSSANDLKDKLLEAGADLFWRKPIPGQSKLVRDLRSQVPLPANWRVLVADDDSIVLMVLQLKLQAALPGADVTAVGSASAALEAALSTPFDLLIFDENIGDNVKGTDIARRIRAESGSPNVNAVIAGFSAESMVAGAAMDAVSADFSHAKGVRSSSP